MSARKKRKNAGEGYGYMFHGSFGTKAKAVAKEKKTKGAWVKGTLTNKGYRYLVMSPRTNPIKRKKKDPTIYAVERDGRVVSQFYEKKVNAKRAAKQLGGKVITVRPGDVAAGGFLTKRTNPHELLIMGANPEHSEQQEITLPPGATIVIRTPRQNPVNPDRFTSAHAIARGLKRQAPGLIQTGRQRKVAKMVRSARKHKYDWIGDLGSGGLAPGMNPGDDRFMIQAAQELYGKPLSQLSAYELSQVAMKAARLKTQPRQNVELGTYENGIFHPWTRRPKSRQKRAIRRQNPDAIGIREDFTGMPSEHYTVQHEAHMPAGDYALLGKLLTLYVKPIKGEQVLELRPKKVQVVSDESARQIWFVGGEQDFTEQLPMFGAIDRGAGVFQLGQARRIDYEQRKEHVKDPDQDHWRHQFGEETGELPTALFDARHKRLLLEGGAYQIRREGIVN